MRLSEHLETKIKEAFSPLCISIVDETWKHAGHAGAITGKGHFILHLVSEKFEGVERLDRNRMIFSVLKEEMATSIHALSIRAQTPMEWNAEKT
jgi:BolA protein